MRLRSLIVAGLCVACVPASRPARPALMRVPGIRSDLTADEQVQQALSRLTYGARPGDVGRVRAQGLERWIALQLTPERINDRAGDSVSAAFGALKTPTTELTEAFRDVRQA